MIKEDTVIKMIGLVVVSLLVASLFASCASEAKACDMSVVHQEETSVCPALWCEK